MFLDPQTQAQVQDPRVGLTGNAPADVRASVTPGQGYSTFLTGANMYGGLRSMARGNFLGGVMGAVGGAGAGLADWAFNPAGNEAQTQVDTSWLSHARNNDMFEPPASFKRAQKHSFVGNFMGGALSSGIRARIANGPGFLRYHVGRTAVPLDRKFRAMADGYRLTDLPRNWIRRNTLNLVDPRTARGIKSDLYEDLKDKLLLERAYFRDPRRGGVVGILDDPLEGGTNAMIASMGLSDRYRWVRRSRFFEDLEMKGGLEALRRLAGPNSKEGEVLAQAAKEIAIKTAPYAAAGTGAAAAGYHMVGRRKEKKSEARQKVSAFQIDQANLLIGAALAREVIDRGQVTLVPRGGQKSSSGKVVISSPLEKRANFTPVLREAINMTPYGTPGLGGGLGEAWKNRPEALGGRPGWMKNVVDLKNLLSREELIVNASGVPVGRKTTFLPGMAGKLLRVPVAIGGLVAINSGLNYYQKKKREAGADARFETAINTLRNDESFRQNYLELVDPNTETGMMVLPKVRKGFDVLDRYAPDVAEDPELASQFVESLIAGVDQGGVAMSPSEYAQHVEQAVSLQNAIDKRNKSTIFDNLGTLAGRLIDPE